jgi:ABC-type antimicrobial peptide transport system permease subunit
LARHFLGESLFHSTLALAASLVLVELALPFFGHVTGRRLSLDLSQIDLLAGLAALTFLTGIVSGLYPALFLSSVSPAQVIKRVAHSRGRSARLRKGLVIVQFTLSTVLIIGTLVVGSQVSFIRSRDLGMTRDNIVYHLMQKNTRDSVDAARLELLKHPDIESVSSASYLPSDVISWVGAVEWDGRPAGRELYPAFLAVVIACLGLLGLAAFAVERRTKEIGIRKVMGASAPRLAVRLSREFVVLVLLANVVAWPVAYYAMSRWLQDFAYRIGLGLWPFVLAGAGAFIVALLTVGAQTIRAAAANPVETLRYE